MNDAPRESEKKRMRSPGYPSINLEEALEKARQIKTKEGGGRHFIHHNAAMEHWSYKPGSSQGFQVIAALKYFGLLEEQGAKDARQIRLTDMAQNLLFFEEKDERAKFDKILKEVALYPAIHKELWSEYKGTLPSESSMVHYLAFTRTPRFSQGAAEDLYNEFKNTIKFAKLDKPAIIDGHEETYEEDTMNNNMPTSQETLRPTSRAGELFQKLALDPNIKAFENPLHISDTKIGKVEFPYPLTKQELDRLKELLEKTFAFFADTFPKAKELDPQEKKSEEGEKERALDF